MENVNYKNQNGRSMIEMLGVLAIIGVLSVGGIAGYSKAMTKYRINKAIEQITLIAGNVRSFFAPQKNYVGVRCTCYDTPQPCSSDENSSNKNGCPIIKKAKILPDEMITLDDNGKITDISNAFGKKIYIVNSNKSKIGDNQVFRISYQIPKDEEICIELLNHNWTTAGVGYVGVGYGFFRTFPVPIDLAAENCSYVISNSSNSVEKLEFSLSFNPDTSATGVLWLN